MAVLACSASRPCGRTGGRRAPLILVVAALLGLTLTLASGTGAFVAPRAVGPAAARNGPAGRAAPVAGAPAALGPHGAGAVDQVEALRRESLEACLLASEAEPETVERCTALSYELAVAEQLLFKRQAAFRYIDHDSF
uniref:Uncharacterized protein n=1 Tax=Alexandrium catenella TaxID=2925 RepID=A0A7S1W1I5_ALECA|eukprot:CAMPEP_0171217046 /NCGR_PEP_ID=MMETSP0790-20130122/32488_1 /TAXON_ID=2925 /ORGANISM="Alexandrium catenella, Strain OF101" /LENGTH=137 /DNA_ID=CAMNT_0011682833 /DNA_START=70 /DNA_END=483 /DNA_ORIENTATION=+